MLKSGRRLKTKSSTGYIPEFLIIGCEYNDFDSSRRYGSHQFYMRNAENADPTDFHGFLSVAICRICVIRVPYQLLRLNNKHELKTKKGDSKGIKKAGRQVNYY